MSPDLNLRHLRAALETARRGSLSAAAQAVSLSQPAVTQAVASLETRLGQPLFERRPGGMTPTPAMATLAPRLAAALALVTSPRVTAAQLRAFVAVADGGGYAAAALATGLSEPSLHRAVADLSLALRRTLVERRGRGLALTEAGRRTARAFRLAQAELAAGLAELEGLAGRETGRIAIGAMPLSRARLLPAALTAFHRAHPAVDIAIVEGSHAELIEPLRDGALDLLIGALRDPSPGPDVEQRPLFDDRPVVLARRGHPLGGLSPSLAELARYPWTVAAPGAPLRVLWERMFTDRGITPPHVPIECGSVITIRELLRASDFLTLLSPDQVAVELEAGWLVRVGAPPPGLARTIGLTTRAGWRPTPLQAAFVETLEAQT